MEILYHKNLDLKNCGDAFFSTIEHLKNGNFGAAEVKKMPSANLYRAKFGYAERVLFKFGKFSGKSYLLLLELVYNHDYARSKFLRGVPIDENKLLSLKNISGVEEKDYLPLSYLNPKQNHFHFLDKIISFDDEQSETLYYPPPLILIGSAGSGKTALALEKLKLLKGEILYVTLSPYLADYAARLYYSNNYEDDEQEIEFLCFKEFLESISIPEGKKIDFREFEQWFLPHKHHSGIKDAHKLFEEFSGVIAGNSIEKEFLSRHDYLSLGIKQSIFLREERDQVYLLFEKYLQFLKDRKFYDINIIAHKWINLSVPKFDFVVVDEVQDYTNVQLYLILKSLKKPDNFILCGDSNQIVHPNFFSWSKIKTMFYRQLHDSNITRILTTNYRNSPQVTEIANRLLKIKSKRFGSIDKESTYLIRSVSAKSGEVVLLNDLDKRIGELNEKTMQSTRFAVLVMRNEDKVEAGRFFKTPLLFSVQEAKGLEYENIILYNFISSNEKSFREICADVTLQDVTSAEIMYSRSADKSDKDIEVFKFFINSLFVAFTRAIGNLYIIEKNHKHDLLNLLELNISDKQLNVQQQISSRDEWQREAQKLEKQGREEQADLIRKTVLGTQPVPWEVITVEKVKKLQEEAFIPDIFNKKAKDKLFDYALIYNQSFIFGKLIQSNYKRAENPLPERSSLLRRTYVNFAADNPKLIMPAINKYGVDFRNEFNQTPLMIAAWTGCVTITTYLISLGAKTELVDNLGKNALQTALLQSYSSTGYAKSKLGKIYPLVVSESLNVKVDNRLVKINKFQTEYQLLNLLIAIQTELIKSNKAVGTCGFTAGEIVDIFESFPENILMTYRKRQQYINAVLARNEISRKDLYNKRIFLRLERGYYVINPDLEIQINEEWINIYDLMQTVKLTPLNNYMIMKLRLETHCRNLADRQKQIEETITKEKNKTNCNYNKMTEMRNEIILLKKTEDKTKWQIWELERKIKDLSIS